MSPITHSILPILLWKRKQPLGTTPLYILGLVAIAGNAPDILQPHLLLEARLSSWSHTLLAYLVFQSLVLVIQRKNAWILGSAYLMHLGVDWVTGGVPLLYPLATPTPLTVPVAIRAAIEVGMVLAISRSLLSDRLIALADAKLKIWKARPNHNRSGDKHNKSNLRRSGFHRPSHEVAGGG